MAGMKSWLEKIKSRILKKNLDDDLLKSKIQRENENANEFAKEKELPDLITPTNKEINEIQREEAIRLNQMYEREKIIKSESAQMQSTKGIERDFVHFTDVPKRTSRT